MRLDLRRETGLPLREVPNWIPKRHGKKVHYSTVYRWATKGARGRVLESVFIGGVRYTTIESIERFLTTRTRAIPDAITSEEVDAELRAAGL